MISHKHKCLFVHIPKVAGQSIEEVFLLQLGLEWNNRSSLLLRKNSDPDLGPPRLAHLTCNEYLKYNYISHQDFDDYFKFSFVRNPWARLYSEYRYRNFPFSFKHFILDYLPKCKTDDYVNFNGNYRHLMSQNSFLYIDNQCAVDFVGKFENIEQDFDKIAQKVFGQRVALPHKNKTNSKTSIVSKFFRSRAGNKDYKDEYDIEMIEFVDNWYQDDIRLFDYQFE